MAKERVKPATKDAAVEERHDFTWERGACTYWCRPCLLMTFTYRRHMDLRDRSSRPSHALQYVQ
eukprot:1760353-Prorocentrum_lima.AAC.1